MNALVTTAILSDLETLSGISNNDNSSIESQYEMLIHQKDELSKTLELMDEAFEPRHHGCGGKYMWRYYFCPGFACCSTTHLTMHLFFLFLIIHFCLFISALADPSISIHITSIIMVIGITAWAIWQFGRVFRWRTISATMIDNAFVLILTQLQDFIKVDKVHLMNDNSYHYRNSSKIIKLQTYTLLIALVLISMVSVSLLLAIEINVGEYTGTGLALTFIFYVSGEMIGYFGMYFMHKYGENSQIIDMVMRSEQVLDETNSLFFENATNIKNESVDVGNLSRTKINEIKEKAQDIIAEYYDIILAHRYGDDSIYAKESTVSESDTTTAAEKLVNVASVTDGDHAEMLQLAKQDSIGLME
eukprot:442027_1